DPTQAQVWGLGRTVALEYPRLWGGLIDLPAVLDGRTAQLIARALAGVNEEDQLAVRPSGLLARRLTHAAAPAVRRVHRHRGTALITGGAGGFGVHLARWLAAGGVDHLVLVEAPGGD